MSPPATSILTDTLNRTFDTLIGTAYQHINFQIRGKAAFNNDTAAAVNGTADRKPIRESVAVAVRRLHGVAYVDGSVSGYAQFVANGNAIGNAGSALGLSFDPNRQAVNGQTVANELSSAVRDALSFLSTALLVFALISLFVAPSRSSTRSRSLSASAPESWPSCGSWEPAGARCSGRCWARRRCWVSAPP